MKNEHWIEAKMELLDMVTWDRFTVGEWDDESRMVTVYGWIDRDDDHEDFVVLRLLPGKPSVWGFTTSSAEHSEEIMKRLYGEADGHNPCQRVEDSFSVDNCINLQTELGER